MSDLMVESLTREEDARVEKMPKAGRPWLMAFGVGLLFLVVFLAFFGGSAALFVGLAVLTGLGVCGLLTLFGLSSGTLLLDLGGRRRALDALSSMIEDGATALVVTDGRGSVRYANATYRALTAPVVKNRVVSPERLLTRREESEMGSFALMRAARKGDVWEAEFTLPAPEGMGTRRYRVRTHPLPTQSNWTVWETSDITAEHETREIHQKLSAQLGLVLDEAPVGVFAAQADGSLNYANATLLRWLGRDKAALGEGKLKLNDLIIGDALKLAAPKPQEGAQEDAKPDAFEAELKTVDGARLAVRIIQSFVRDRQDGHLSSRAIVLARGAEGAPEEAMRAAEARFARIFNSAPVGIVMVDEDGAIVEANNAFQTLVSGRAVRGGKLLDLVALADQGEVQAVLSAAIAGKPHLGLAEVRLQDPSRKDAGFDKTEKTEKVGQLYASRIERAEEGKAAALLYMIDATEQKSLELQFAQSQKMQAVGQLAGGIAHDFNNLLTAIIGFSDLLLVRHQAGDPSFADVMQIKQNANRASNLVRQLLAFSRRQTLRPRVLQLTDVLADLSDLLRRLLGEKVALKVVHGRNLFPVKVDESQLEQVIINLAVNARDAMPEGGQLTIRTANVSQEEARSLGNPLIPVGEYVLCEVSDTGVGIPKEVIGRVFEPFFTTKEVGKGTGLGLSTVYGIIKQTGGFIFPTSEVGKGTSFRIYLPRYKEGADDVQEPEAVLAPETGRDLSGRGVILLVEDEDAVRAFAVRALESCGYQVIAAANGEAALEEVAAHKGDIDMVVSDVVMPGMDGPTLIKRLREQMPTLKVVFISGYAEDAFRRNLPHSENFAFLPKPFSLKQLAAKVKEVMEAKG